MIEVMGKKIDIEKEITLLEFSKQFQNSFKNEIILAKVNNRLKDLTDVLYPKNNYKIEFLDISDPNGFRTYQRSIIFLFIFFI